jgi:hypothetical protein
LSTTVTELQAMARAARIGGRMLAIAKGGAHQSPCETPSASGPGIR